MTVGSWGPFRPDIDWPERKAQLRTIRTALRLLTGERGRACAVEILRAEISGGDDEVLREASEAIDRLGPLDRRRVLTTFSAVTFDGGVCIPPAKPQNDSATVRQRSEATRQT